MQQTEEFKHIVYDYYHANKRAMPWRDNVDPYFVLVSEVMLQQTQVDRVIPKFQAFIHLFPSLEVLAQASLPEVLSVWVGLGYNRRALWLQEAAQQIVASNHGQVPDTLEELVALKGIGPHTAGAILNYAFNKPVVFIETNIRTAYLHHFFPDQQEVSDQALLPFIEATLDRHNPREWFWALMDYGSYLKKHHKNPSRRSKTYKKQPAFAGSKRQIRGYIIKLLVNRPYNYVEITECIEDARLQETLDDLARDGIIMSHDNAYQLTDVTKLP